METGPKLIGIVEHGSERMIHPTPRTDQCRTNEGHPILTAAIIFGRCVHQKLLCGHQYNLRAAIV
jgi:hypothetical protein